MSELYFHCLTLLVRNIRNQAIDKHIPNVFLV